MRWRYAALAVLLVAQQASAARMLVIRQHGVVASQSGNAGPRQLNVLESVLKTLGVDYDVVQQSVVAAGATAPATNAGQAAIRTGVVSIDATGLNTRSYGGIIHMGMTAGISGSNRVTGYNPDTLTLGASWPSIPTGFLGCVSVPSSGIWSNSATCTTGVVGALGAFAATTANEISEHMVGQPEVWKCGTGFYYKRSANGLTIDPTNPGVTKSRVVMGSSSVAYHSDGASGTTSCTDCDSVPRPSTYYDSPKADTALVWTRQRTTADRAILVFALPSYASNGGTDNDAVTIAQMVAIMDSAAGGTLIGQKPGWRPKQMAFVVSGAFMHSDSDVNSTGGWDVHGTFYPSDTAAVKAGIDSLASLNIPVMVSVNIDSVGQYPSEKAWWSQRLPLARFSPESKTGTGDASITNTGLASRYLAADLFGLKRPRQLITTDRFNYGTYCDGTDTTLSCLLEYARNRLDSIPEFKGRMSSAIIAPRFDYFASQITRATVPSPDSLKMALLRARYDTAINGTMYMESTPSASWGNSAGGTVVPASTGPGAYYPNPRFEPVRLYSGQLFGPFKWLNMRHMDEDATGVSYATHNIENEFLTGFFGAPWYTGDTPYWYHVMRARLDVVIVRPGDLGFKQTATANLTRPGYNTVKWVVNQVRSVNKFAGRTVIGFGYPEDIDP